MSDKTHTPAQRLDYSLRNARADETDKLVAIGLSTGLFSSEEADALLGTSLRMCVHGSQPGARAARVATCDDRIAGWTFLAADESASGVWELFWIGVSREAEGTGAGTALLRDAEQEARAAGARLLLVSTSSTDATARARAFYERMGYDRCGQIPDFYGDGGDDKVIYAKRLNVAQRQA